MNEKVKVSDLRAGDIVLLEPSEDKISKLIAKITHSPVSHTTLSCGPKEPVGNVIEETPPCALVGTLLNRTSRTAYVMRLNPEVEDCQPVMDIASRYVSEKLPYAKAQLPFIALYCIAGNITGGTKLQGIVMKFVSLAMEILIQLEDSIIYKGQEAMMCSQFAYHCYKEAGEAYEIHMKEMAGLPLIDGIIERLQADPSKYDSQLFLIRGETPEVTDEQVDCLIDELYEELNNDDTSFNRLDSNELSEDFIIEVTRFCIQVVKTFLKEEDCDKTDAVSHLLKLKDMYEYFISPGDLFTNTKNLICLGTVDYSET